MAVVPAPRTWIPFEVVLDSMLNTTVRDPLAFLLAPPIFEGRQTVAQSLTSGAYASLLFDTEDVDSAGGHSTVTNTSRYTAVYAGWYEISGAMGVTVNAAGIRALRWSVNGTVLNASQIALQATGATSAQYPARTKHIFLNVGDFIELQGFQNSGGALNTDVTTLDQSNFMLRWVSN